MITKNRGGLNEAFAETAVSGTFTNAHLLTQGVFVGRERELAELCGGLDAAMTGQGHLLMLVGEPGIGKTRLAEKLTERAQARGVSVLWGRCWEAGGAPAYWPWVQIVRSHASGRDPAELRAQMGGGWPYIAQIAPELEGAVDDRRPPTQSSPDPDRERFHLFDAMATFLRNAAAVRPLVLILDDLHAADRPTLLLLEFLARELRGTHLLMIGSYRDVEVRSDPELARMLSAVSRHGASVPLRGLGETEAVHLMKEALGVHPSDALAAGVLEATGGNPFFMSELLRLLVADGCLPRAPATPGGFRPPDGVRGTIRRRLLPLSLSCLEMLRVAAALGREFELTALLHCHAASIEELLDVLDEAHRAGILCESRGTSNRYRFAHGLIRETLYDDLPSAERVPLHRRIGAALESLYHLDPEPHVAELAHHFCAAAPGGEMAKAIDYAVRAGRRATALLAHEEAVTHYRNALRVLALDDGHEEHRCELLLALGAAQDAAGDAEESAKTLEEAAGMARGLGKSVLFARAALGCGGQWALKFTSTFFDKGGRADLLQEALAGLGNSDGALSVRLLARVALTLRFSGPIEQSETLSQEAVAMARRLEDVDTLVYALSAQHAVLLGPDHLDERQALAAEILHLARETRDRELALRGHALSTYDFLEAGDGARLDREIDTYARLAVETRDPFDLWMSALYAGMQCLMRGHLDQAEHLIHHAAVTARRMPGQQAADENAGWCFVAQMFALRRHQQRLGELDATIQELHAKHPAFPVWTILLILIDLELGRLAAARERFEGLLRDDTPAIPRDSVWLGSICLLGEACHRLGDARRAASLHRLLLPYGERNVALGSAVSLGAAARYLGLAAVTMSRWNAAARHFEAALGVNARIHAETWIAHTEHDYANMLTARGKATDRERAGAFHASALDRADTHGLVALASSARAALLALRRADRSSEECRSTDDLSTGATAAEDLFRKEGDYWTVVFAGIVSRMKHTKGFAYLALLLQHPGREIHALDLVRMGRHDVDRSLALGGDSDEHLARLGMHAARLDGPTEVVDQRATVAYRRRLQDLHVELEEARRLNDLGRTAKLDDEIAFLTRHLARHLGLGGRPRADSAAERARVSVMRAIKTARARIAESNPALGLHLSRTIRTGLFCCYMPDPRLPTLWRS